MHKNEPIVALLITMYVLLHIKQMENKSIRADSKIKYVFWFSTAKSQIQTRWSLHTELTE